MQVGRVHQRGLCGLRCSFVLQGFHHRLQGEAHVRPQATRGIFAGNNEEQHGQPLVGQHSGVRHLFRMGRNLEKSERLLDPILFMPLPTEQVEEQEHVTVTAIQTTEPTLLKLSTEDIHCLQRTNVYCKRIFASFDTDPNTRHQFTMKDGILYHLMQVSGITHLALVVPQSLALTLVRSIHLEFQHPGTGRTYDALATQVYWRDMWTSVRKYMHGYNVCQLHSLKQHTFPSKHDRPLNAPWTRIAIDCVGFTCDSSQGHIGVMTGICLATQYPWAEPICAKNTACVQAAVMKILTTAPNM